MALQKIKVVKKQLFPVSLEFSSNNLKFVQMSNNISSISFSGSLNNNLRSQLKDVKLNENIKVLSSYSLYNCERLSSFQCSNNLIQIQNDSFNSCSNLSTVLLNTALETIGDNAFKNCRNLLLISFSSFESDINTSNLNLRSIGKNILNNSSNCKYLVVPGSITALNLLDTLTLAGSSISDLTFLGINSSLITNLTASSCLGLSVNCDIYSSDNKKYRYTAASNGIQLISSYKSPSLEIPTGVPGKMRLRKPLLFTRNCVEWAITPSSRTAESRKDNFPNEECPIITFLLDTMTSVTSKKFYNSVIKNDNFIKLLKDTVNCYVFVLDRCADLNNTNADHLYFSSIFLNFNPNFVSINFKYKNKLSSVSTSTTNHSDIITLITQLINANEFSKFNFSPFDLKLDDPFIETIPLGSDVATTGYIPWWYSNGTITTINDWSI